jgi:Domain of unknown function (DUF4352)
MQSKPIAAIIVLSLVVASLLVSGCTNPTTNTSPTPPPVTSLTAISITAKSEESPQQFNISTPNPGNMYVVYNVTVINTYAEDKPIYQDYFTVLDKNNNVYGVDELIQGNYLNNAFPYNPVITQPGDKVTGLVVFEVPQNATFVTLRYNDLSGVNITVKL